MSTQTTRPGGNRGAVKLRKPNGHQDHAAGNFSVQHLLDRLDRVRETGPGRWIARCPGHDDRSPSLSIRRLEDGRILLHDFAGCDAQSILAAIGLTFSDLYDRPLSHHAQPTRNRIPARDLIGLVDHEALIVGMVGAAMLKNKKIDAETWDRLATAVRRIGEVRDYVEH